MAELVKKIVDQVIEMGWYERDYVTDIKECLGLLYTGRFKLIIIKDTPIDQKIPEKYSTKCFEYKHFMRIGSHTFPDTTYYRYVLYDWKKR